MTKAAILPPDAPLLRLAAAVNARLAAGASVSFFRTADTEYSGETGIVYADGDRRAVVRTQRPLSEADADELVQAVAAWSASDVASKWTTDPAEAA